MRRWSAHMVPLPRLCIFGFLQLLKSFMRGQATAAGATGGRAHSASAAIAASTAANMAESRRQEAERAAGACVCPRLAARSL